MVGMRWCLEAVSVVFSSILMLFIHRDEVISVSKDWGHLYFAKAVC